jgi:signal transduction histidine kinase/DNA-binding response OmpR family regulator
MPLPPPSDPEAPIDILVVDDTVANLESMRALLADTAANVVTAGSGTDALRLLLKQDFALILLDVQMPDLDGYATAQLIRSRERSRQTPIIFLTAYGRSEAQVLRGYSLGAVDFLFKPIVPEILKSKIAFFIELQRNRERARVQAELLRQAEKRELERALREAKQQYQQRILEEERDRERRLAEAMNARAEELTRLVEEKATAERALRSTNERLELLADIASQLLVTQDPTSHIQRIYAGVGAHLGLEVYLHYGVDETGQRLLIGSHMGVPEALVEELAEIQLGEGWIGQSVRTGERQVHDVAFKHTEGQKLAGRLGVKAMACIPLVSAEKLLGAVVVASRAPRTFSQEELAVLQVGCDQLAVATERHALIRRLRESDRRKDEFLAMLGHELRNPLAPIRNALEVFRAKFVQDERLQRTLAAADRQVRHMTRLLDDLLDVSRITRGKVALRRERVELSVLIEQAVHATEPIIRDRKHSLEVALPQDTVVLDADPARVTQVLANLLQNAAKYSEPGGRISLRAGLEAQGLRICVEDTGIGIRPQMLQHIFDMFVQEEPTSDRALGGLGLGLTLVKSLVEMHGGRVEAHSEGLGRGSRFEVLLPLSEAGAARPAAPRK